MAPITTKRTSCFLRTRRMSPNRNSGKGFASNTGVDDLSCYRIRDPFAGTHIEEPIDEGVVGVVVVGEAESQLEAARPDQLAQGLEAGLDSAALPASDRRLSSADRSSELVLSEVRTEAGNAQYVAAGHGTRITYKNYCS